MKSNSDSLNIHAEYNMQSEFVKLRKEFINIYTIELFYAHNLKLKNNYIEIIKKGIDSKCSRKKVKKEIKEINRKFQKEHCVERIERRNVFEMNKHACFAEKEILNRYFFHLSIKQSNYDIREEDAALYVLFRRFCFALLNGCNERGRSKRLNEGGGILAAKLFCSFLDRIMKGDRKNVYFESLKGDLRNRTNDTKEGEAKVEKKNPCRRHTYYSLHLNNCKNGDSGNSRKRGFHIAYTICHIRSYNFSKDRMQRAHTSRLSKCRQYKHGRLKIDLESVKHIVQKYVYNDFYYNVFNSIYYTLIRKSVNFVADFVHACIIPCHRRAKENRDDNAQERILQRGELFSNVGLHPSMEKICANNFFFFFKIFFTPLNMYRQYTGNKEKINENVFFNSVKLALKESIENFLHITVVNMDKLHRQLPFGYLFNLFLFYFIFLDINFYFTATLVYDSSLSKEEKQFYELFAHSQGNNDVCEDKTGIFHIRGDNSEKKKNYTFCLICSYNKLKKESMHMQKKKKFFFFSVLYILHYNYLKRGMGEKKGIYKHQNGINDNQEDDSDEPFLSYYFNNIVSNFYFFKKYNFSFLKFREELKRDAHQCCTHYCHCCKKKKKNKERFRDYFEKVNKKWYYLQHLNGAIMGVGKKHELINRRDITNGYSKISVVNTQSCNGEKKIGENNIIQEKVQQCLFISSTHKNVPLSNRGSTCNCSQNVEKEEEYFLYCNMGHGNENKMKNYQYGKFYEQIRENITKGIFIGNREFTHNLDLHDYVSEKIKIFLENVKVFLFPLLEKLYRKSVMYINLRIYLFMVRSSFVLEKEKTKIFQKMQSVNLLYRKERRIARGKVCRKVRGNHFRSKKRDNIFWQFSAYTYCNFLRLLRSKKSKKVIFKKVKNKKIILYLKRGICNVDRWRLLLMCRLRNAVDVYRHSRMRNSEKNFPPTSGGNARTDTPSDKHNGRLSDSHGRGRGMEKFVDFVHFTLVKKGQNICLENRRHRQERDRCANRWGCYMFAGMKTNQCTETNAWKPLQKCVFTVYRNMGTLFPNVCIYIWRDDFYVQSKKDVIIFHLKQKSRDVLEDENVYYKFEGKKYTVFENVYTLKKTYKISYINLCVLFHRYCFFFYDNNPLIFSYLFSYVYCMCANCMSNYLIIKSSAEMTGKQQVSDCPYEKVRGCFYKQNGILIKYRNNTLIRTFYYLVLFLLIRYQTLVGSVSHSGLQSCIPKRIMTMLHKKLGINMECFSSPFNAILPKYCSFCPDIDKFFGSSGNFFNFEFYSGAYEVNPPFDIFLINKLIRNSYTFSTRLFESREEEYISTCDCFVFILQNEKAKIRGGINKRVVLKIKRLWENLSHIKQKKKKKKKINAAKGRYVYLNKDI
ncbi:conserved Plasmodium protein, unknown function [Plasmodium ovale curtisi]|uniref:PCIF1 WW domain-containing protein n=1 Tax=Plasmodium ovale curtisi TaxID=864141 RepID=A0A1A8VKM1_PLAOA|nr:conserved Plasmodium protein, unknown function [Plasmodium ovale curtisi]